MKFKLILSKQSKIDLKELKSDGSKKAVLKAVVKTLKFLQENPRHPSLNTHPYTSIKGPNGEKIFEAYAQNQTANAYRVFFYYGPGKREITVFTITPHP